MSFAYHTFYITDFGKLYVFGGNSNGQLGLNHKRNMTTPQMLIEKQSIVSFCCGETHSMMLMDNGKLFVIGNNKNGQLGVENIPEQKIPLLLLKDSTITKITCGLKHSMFMTSEGQVYVFGFNDHGELGNGMTFEQTTPALMETREGFRVKNIYCGGLHSFLLYDDGGLYAFGCNRNGQLGLGNAKTVTEPTLLVNEPKIKDVYCGSEFSMYILETGEIYVFGNNRSGQLGLGNNVNQKTPQLLKIEGAEEKTVKKICCGESHTVVLMKTGEVYVFGLNLFGQIALEGVEQQHTPKLLPFPHKVKNIFCGLLHTGLLTHNSDLYVFGSNGKGQLGLGNTINQKTWTLLMNDPSISYFMGESKPVWTSEVHSSLSKNFQDTTFSFLLVLKYYQGKAKIRMPKPLLYNILRYAYYNY